MGKASKLLQELMATESPEEAHGPRPKLRLRPELADQALGPAAHVEDILDRLSGEGTSKEVVLHDASTGTSVVAIPVEEYLELVTSYIRDMNLSNLATDGQIRPSDAALAELGVEQEDPQATWQHVGDP
jgi:hypothetical protein